MRQSSLVCLLLLVCIRVSINLGEHAFPPSCARRMKFQAYLTTDNLRLQVSNRIISKLQYLCRCVPLQVCLLANNTTVVIYYGVNQGALEQPVQRLQCCATRWHWCKQEG